MKLLLPLAAVCMLAGCASQLPRPANYGTRAPDLTYAAPAVGSVTEDGWRVVSVTPANPAPPPAGVYGAPVYVEPDYYFVPPVSFSLGVILGRGAYIGSRYHPRWRHHGRRR